MKNQQGIAQLVNIFSDLTSSLMSSADQSRATVEGMIHEAARRLTHVVENWKDKPSIEERYADLSKRLTASASVSDPGLWEEIQSLRADLLSELNSGKSFVFEGYRVSKA